MLLDVCKRACVCTLSAEHVQLFAGKPLPDLSIAGDAGASSLSRSARLNRVRLKALRSTLPALPECCWLDS